MASPPILGRLPDWYAGDATLRAPPCRRMRPRSASTVLLALSTVLLSWLWMMAVHEFGHVLHAWLSGGTVTRVVLHPLAISRTDVAPDPDPLFVVWGGPIWGCMLPITAWLVLRWWRYAFLLRFFAGFCLIANGAYLAAGAAMPVGDAQRLLELGVPAWALVAFGAIAVPAGLWLWDGLGKHFGIRCAAEAPDWRVGCTLLALLIATVAAGLLLSERI